MLLEIQEATTVTVTTDVLGNILKGLIMLGGTAAFLFRVYTGITSKLTALSDRVSKLEGSREGLISVKDFVLIMGSKND